jgi:hypothetical protein
MKINAALALLKDAPFSCNPHFKKLYLLLLISLMTAMQLPAQALQDHCTGIENWDILDWRGDGKIIPIFDYSCPAGYGPEVLHIQGGVVLGMMKGLKMSKGTVVALYRENEPRDYDADGILMVKSEYDSDISVAHNVKMELPHVWLEQDNDYGFQLRSLTQEGKEENLAEHAGFGLVTDSWNKTGWIWQKVKFDEEKIYAKFWPAHAGEPEEWALEAEFKSSGERVGFRINSGDIHLAYFAADAKDITIQAPTSYLYAPVMRITKANKIAVTLLTNRKNANEQNLKFSAISNGKLIVEKSLKLDMPAGEKEFDILLSTKNMKNKESNIDIYLPQEPAEGPLQFSLSDDVGTIIAERTVMVLPVQKMRERFVENGEILDIINTTLNNASKESRAYKAVKVISDAAKAHLDHAITLFNDGDIDGSDMAFRFVAEALAELEGYKGTYLSKLDPNLKLSFQPWDKADRRGIGASPEHGITDAYSLQHVLSFGTPTLSAQSMVMGKTYDVTIPWSVAGTTPDKDYKFLVRLVSPLGHRKVAASTTGPDVPTNEWIPGNTYVQHVKLSISPEDSEMGKTPPAQPAVLDEYHYLLVTVIDPETGGRLILGNEPGPQSERVGQSFSAGEFYISSTPVEIKKLALADGEAGKKRNDSFAITNSGQKRLDAGVLFSVTAETGDIVYQRHQPIDILPGNSAPIRFDWKSAWAGNLDVRVQVIKKGITLTEAKSKIVLSLPGDEKIIISKSNHVIKKNGTFVTPIFVDCGRQKANISIYADARKVGAAKGSGAVVVNSEPWFGYYDVKVQTGKFSYAQRIIATVVETDGMDIVVNGETFLVKGVNVHGLDGRSPERSASMMRIMRDLGFNAWRGDYPPLWQMELAYELNSFYTVLGPFSCTHTDGIFARQAGPPMATARELSRLFVQRYKDSAGVLLWNSCNEIGNENEAFLLTLQPVFKAHDPYNRPVHYSNLFGQNLALGQDAMGINYYFGVGQTAKDRQPIIQRSIDIARSNNVPIMFNEFNSFVGAIHSTGVDAMYGMYNWGIEQGMCGGFQYMKGNSTSHPGIFDDGFNTHKIYNEAIVDVLADAKVELPQPQIKNGTITIEVKNKRRFTLRQIKLTLEASGKALSPLQLSDLQPNATQRIEVELPDTADQNAITLNGHLDFVTHFGFKSKIPVSLIVSNE